MFHIIQIIVWLPLKILFPAKFYGRKNIPKGPCILASNHTSNVDVILFISNTWEKKYYLAKKELFKKRIFGWFIKMMGAIKIDRQGTDITAIKKSLKILKDRKKLFIFPEGTRVHNENMELGEVKQGVSMFAIKGKVPIVPIFISKKPKLFRRTKVFIGKPFELNDYFHIKMDSEELKKASDVVILKLNEVRDNSMKTLTKNK